MCIRDRVYIDQLEKLSKIAKQNLINVIFIWKTAYELIQFINDMNNSKKNLNKKRRKYPPWTLESDWRKVISSPCPESSWICSSAISSLIKLKREFWLSRVNGFEVLITYIQWKTENWNWLFTIFRNCMYLFLRKYNIFSSHIFNFLWRIYKNSISFMKSRKYVYTLVLG